MHETNNICNATETKTPRWIKMSLEEMSSEPEINMNGKIHVTFTGM